MHRGIALGFILASTAARADVAYVEALGKAGAYGLGYDHELGRWSVSAGGAASFIVVRGQQLLTLAPYLHAPLLERRCNALFAELGAELVHSKIASPVADWSGTSSTGAGGFASLGWQRTGRRVVLRGSASVAIGRGGVGPMLGFAVGVKP